jgi:transposase InsO family protein
MFLNDVSDEPADVNRIRKRMKKTMLTVEGTLYGKPALILIDSGSSAEFVSADFITRHRLSTTPMKRQQRVILADGTKKRPTRRTLHTPVRMADRHYKINFTVLPLNRYDAILGMSWLRQYKPLIDWSALTFEPTTWPLTDDVHTSDDSYTAVEVMDVDGQLWSMVNEDGDPAIKSSDDPDCTQTVQEFSDIFAPLPAGLPPARDVDHHIDLQPGSVPPSRSTYRLSVSESAVLRKELDGLLQKGFIRPSKSPYGAPILFVKKKNGELRMCMDYRALNKITIKNKAQMPRQDELLDRTRGSQWFSRMDMRSGYHQVRIYPPDVHKTGFNTQFGHFEFNVLPFGLTNAPATFQTLMNTIFADFNEFVIVYLDDVLIFSRNIEEHRVHVRRVLERLRQHQLYANREKCEFGRTSMHFLGHVVSKDGISMDSSKLDDVRKWPIPKSVEDIRSFLGLTGYYRRFIHKFSQIAAPLSNLTRNLVPFLWTEVEQKAFEDLKTALLTGPVLLVPDDQLPFTVTADASGYAVGATLSQDIGRGLQPTAFMSHRMSPPEMNYPVHEQELLAVIRALGEWRHYLHGQRFDVITDHHSLTFLQTQPKLSKRQVRWLEQLAEFEFNIVYKPGKTNVVADALSRRADHRESAARDADQHSLATLTTAELKVGVELLEEIRRAYANDAECVAALANPSASYYSLRQGLLYRPDGRLRIPNDDSIKGTLLYEAHDSMLCGHVGVNKTARMVGRLFDWPGLRQDVRMYVTTCVGCQANKPSNQRPIGLLQPLPIPLRRWATVTMDLITQLPTSRQQNDSIIVMVDKYSKMVHYAPCKTTVTAPEVAQIFFREIVRHHGIPDAIVSDRDSKFMSKFWQALWTELGTKLKISTSYHPQTDGQTERSNRTLEEMLRAYVNYAQDNWDEKLIALEIAVNSSTQESTGFTPYYLNYGQHPHLPLSMLTDTTDNETAQTMLSNLRDNLAVAKQHLLAAQEKQSREANKSRREHEFDIGEQVMLSTENLNIDHRARKLVAKYAGPHKVIEHPTPNTYRLELPPELSRIHPVFNSSQLKPYKEDNVRFIDRPQITRPPAVIEDENKFEVEEIKSYRVHRGVGQYLVKWKDYADSESSWLPVKSVESPALVERFLRLNPSVRLQVALNKTIRFVQGGQPIRPPTKIPTRKGRPVKTSIINPSPEPAMKALTTTTKPTVTAHEPVRRSQRVRDNANKDVARSQE